MSEAANIEVYRKFIEEGVGVGRLDVIDDMLAPGLELPTVGPAFEPSAAGLRQMNLAFRAGFPDLRGVVEDVVANGEWVAGRVRWTGTNTGELFGQQPTGRTASAVEIEIVRIVDGVIVDLRQVADVPSLMAQLVG